MLLPLYTPTLTDEPNVSEPRVFFGGISVYLDWLGFIVVSVALAISAFYELIEWWTALIGGQAADAGHHPAALQERPSRRV